MSQTITTNYTSRTKTEMVNVVNAALHDHFDDVRKALILSEPGKSGGRETVAGFSSLFSGKEVTDSMVFSMSPTVIRFNRRAIGDQEVSISSEIDTSKGHNPCSCLLCLHTNR